VFGPARPTLEKGEWLLNLSLRDLTSDKHYNLNERQWLRETLRNNVVNRQRFYELGAQYQLTDQFSLGLSIPYVASSWAINTRPFTGAASQLPGPDVIDLRGEGLGDISLTTRWWLGNTNTSRKQNLSLGFGIKFPTGDFDQTSIAPAFNGKNPQPRFSDISVQPGSGGYGLIFEALAFKNVKKSTFTFNATYLAEPRDTNGTPSIVRTLGVASAANANLQVNSVPDTYLVRFGWYYPLGKSGFSTLMAYRIEGSPRLDLFGDQNGFRRPGYESFFEPGINYTNGDHVVTISVPIAHNRFRDLNSSRNSVTGNFDRGDATFPDHIVLASYSYRFGGHRKKKDRKPVSCEKPAATCENPIK
jgi:hypothetical protein